MIIVEYRKEVNKMEKRKTSHEGQRRNPGWIRLIQLVATVIFCMFILVIFPGLAMALRHGIIRANPLSLTQVVFAGLGVWIILIGVVVGLIAIVITWRGPAGLFGR